MDPRIKYLLVSFLLVLLSVSSYAEGYVTIDRHGSETWHVKVHNCRTFTKITYCQTSNNAYVVKHK